MMRRIAVAILLWCACVAACAATPSRVEEKTIEDPVYHRARKLWVYTPMDYDVKQAKAYAWVLCFDGQTYAEEFQFRTLLDRLIEQKRIRPVVAVMVDNGNAFERRKDLANSADFVKFLGGTLVPWVRANYRVSADPHEAMVTGYSAGGLGAAFVGWSMPDVFGNVYSQSAAFWRGAEASDGEPYEWLTSQVSAAAKRPVRFYLEVGAEETSHAVGTGPVFIEANRRMRDALQARGYEVRYEEVPGAHHEEGHWKSKLEEGLVWGLGGS